MQLSELAGYVSQAIFFVSFIWYLREIARANVTTSIATFIILGVTSFSQFWALMVEQEVFPAFFMGVTTLINFAIIILSLKNGNYELRRLDKIILVSVVVGLVAWFVTRSAAVNVYVLTVAIVFSYIPLVGKTFRNPDSEVRGPWMLNFVASVIFLFTITSPTPINWIVQARQILLSSLMVAALTRKKPTCDSALE